MRKVQGVIAFLAVLATVAIMIVNLTQGCTRTPKPSAPPPTGSATVRIAIDAAVPVPAERPDTAFHVRMVTASAEATDPDHPDHKEAIARCRPDEQLTGGACDDGSRYNHAPEVVSPDHSTDDTFGAGWKCAGLDVSHAIAFCLSETRPETKR